MENEKKENIFLFLVRREPVTEEWAEEYENYAIVKEKYQFCDLSEEKALN